MKVQLHQGHALHVPRLDVMDAADIEEVVLVVVGEEPFHLRRVHAAVGLADVDHRQIQAREDVDFHPLGQAGRIRQPQLIADGIADGEKGAQRDRHDEHHHGERAS